MTPEELRAELEAGVVRSIYLVAGEEPLYRDDAVAALRAAALGSGPADFNFEKLESDTNPAALFDSVRTLPVMAPYRVVVVRNPEGARGAAGRGLTDALHEVAKELGSGVAPQGSTVLIVVAAKVDRRARWVKVFGSAATVVCDPPKRTRDITAFACDEAKRQGVSIARGTAEALAERVGPQLLLLRQELAKAALLAGPDQTVTPVHIAAGTSDVAEEPIWDLTDAIGEGRSADALASLAKLMRAGAPPPVVLGSLVSHFRRLLRLCSGAPVQGPPFVRRKLEGQAKRFTSARLLACLRAIHETDMAIKGAGALRPEIALERLVIGLAS